MEHTTMNQHWLLLHHSGDEQHARNCHVSSSKLGVSWDWSGYEQRVRGLFQEAAHTGLMDTRKSLVSVVTYRGWLDVPMLLLMFAQCVL